MLALLGRMDTLLLGRRTYVTHAEAFEPRDPQIRSPDRASQDDRTHNSSIPPNQILCWGSGGGLACMSRMTLAGTPTARA